MRSFILKISGQTSNNLDSAHLIIVDKVSKVLHKSYPIKNSHSEEDFQPDNDEEMSDDEELEDEEPDNLITLDQFQEEARHEAMIRKGVHDITAPIKGKS